MIIKTQRKQRKEKHAHNKQINKQMNMNRSEIKETNNETRQFLKKKPVLHLSIHMEHRLL